MVLGVTPVDKTDFNIPETEPDIYNVNKIYNVNNEWIKYIRERIGTEKMSKND